MDGLTLLYYHQILQQDSEISEEGELRADPMLMWQNYTGQ